MKKYTTVMAIIATILALTVIIVAFLMGSSNTNTSNTSVKMETNASSTPTASNNDSIIQQVQTPQTDVEQTVTVAE